MLSPECEFIARGFEVLVEVAVGGRLLESCQAGCRCLMTRCGLRVRVIVMGHVGEAQVTRFVEGFGGGLVVQLRVHLVCAGLDGSAAGGCGH